MTRFPYSHPKFRVPGFQGMSHSHLQLMLDHGTFTDGKSLLTHLDHPLMSCHGSAQSGVTQVWLSTNLAGPPSPTRGQSWPMETPGLLSSTHPLSTRTLLTVLSVLLAWTRNISVQARGCDWEKWFQPGDNTDTAAFVPWEICWQGLPQGSCSLGPSKPMLLIVWYEVVRARLAFPECWSSDAAESQHFVQLQAGFISGKGTKGRLQTHGGWQEENSQARWYHSSESLATTQSFAQGKRQGIVNRHHEQTPGEKGDSILLTINYFATRSMLRARSEHQNP